MNYNMKYYYLLNGKLYWANSEMLEDKGYTGIQAVMYENNLINWHSSLQPCEITEGELEKLNLHLFYNDKDKGFFRDSPINVTDLVGEKQICGYERCVNESESCIECQYPKTKIYFKHPKQVDESLQDIIWQKFYDEVKPLLEKYNLNNIDSCFLIKVISMAGYAPPVKQVDEASEAVEFAEWLYKGYMMYGDKTHKWTDTINTFTTQELYEIFKSK